MASETIIISKIIVLIIIFLVCSKGVRDMPEIKWYFLFLAAYCSLLVLD